jgi:peroxiredoxin
MSTKWIYATALVIAVFLAFYFYKKYKVAPHIDVKQLSLTDLGGIKSGLENFKGKKLIICFGASWCVNCIEELDLLSKIKREKLSDIEVVVISDESLEKIERFKNRKNYPFTFLKLNTTFGAMGINSIPTTYLVNTNLTVVKETVGYMNWEDASNLEHYKKLMD